MTGDWRRAPMKVRDAWKRLTESIGPGGSEDGTSAKGSPRNPHDSGQADPTDPSQTGGDVGPEDRQV
jgi:hypothetical protein